MTKGNDDKCGCADEVAMLAGVMPDGRPRIESVESGGESKVRLGVTEAALVFSDTGCGICLPDAELLPEPVPVHLVLATTLWRRLADKAFVQGMLDWAETYVLEAEKAEAEAAGEVH